MINIDQLPYLTEVYSGMVGPCGQSDHGDYNVGLYNIIDYRNGKFRNASGCTLFCKRCIETVLDQNYDSIFPQQIDSSTLLDKYLLLKTCVGDASIDITKKSIDLLQNDRQQNIQQVLNSINTL